MKKGFMCLCLLVFSLQMVACARIPQGTPVATVQALRHSPDTVLQRGIATSDLSLVELAIDFGADVNRGAGVSLPPLAEASRKGDSEIVRALLKQGARVETLPGSTLTLAVRTGSLGRISALIAAGADVNSYAQTGRTMVMEAISFGQLEAVHMLLERGANPDARAIYVDPLRVDRGVIGETGLMLAAQNGEVEMTRLLLKSGARTDLVDRWRNTALNYAEIVNAPEVGRLIQAAGQ